MRLIKNPLPILIFSSLTLLALTSCESEAVGRRINIADEEGSPVSVNQLTPPEWSKDAIIYEINVRQYSPAGDFAAVTSDLDRIKDLGVDILWVMPIHPIGLDRRKGSLGSYYSVQDYKAVNPEFGTDADFHSFVDEAHNRGMKVILDWVANHSAWDNVWYPQHDAFYTKDSVTGERIPPVDDWADVADLNYDNVEMRDSMLDAFRYWVEEFDIDGYRCDVAGMVPIDFWQDMSSEVRSIKPDAFLLAEADEVIMHDNAFHMTYGWENHHILNEIAKGHMTANDLLAYFTKNDNTYGKSPYRMYFTSNHDENTWNGTVWERMGDAAHTMAALTYVMPSSMPLVYNGQEDSLAHQLAFFDKDDIGWSGQEVMGDFYRELNAMKKGNEALWNGDFGGDYTARLEKGSVLVLERSRGDNSILAVFNLSNLPVPMDSDLIDVSNMTLETSRHTVSDITSLAAWDYLIYSNN